MYKKIAILGSTGSIGTQALDVARNNNIEVVALSANSNLDLIIKQIVEFEPKIIAVGTKELAIELIHELSDLNIQKEVYFGQDGLIKVAECEDSQIVLNAVVGSAGLLPTLHAIKKGKNVALANKETLVTAGGIVMEAAREAGVAVLPVDSEHSAIFQSLQGNRMEDVRKIILTASGGPFRGKSYDELKNVTREEALNHPNWTMGSKITIDSATLMNKGLEVIEAKWLFNVSSDMLDVIVHPQSVIHSMVEYIDGSIIAQLGAPDMRIPIQYAFSYPYRYPNNASELNLIKYGTLTFEEPDMNTFRCLKLALDAVKEGGTLPTVLNAANEVAVSKFLQGEIGFLDISALIEGQMLSHTNISNPTMDEILEVDTLIREALTKK